MISEYLRHLKEIKDYKPVSLKKAELLLNKIETAFGQSILKAETGSEVEQAIIKAAQTRKMYYNGGFFDDGQHTKFRMGLAAACYLRWAYGEGLINRNIYYKNTFRRPPLRESDWLTDEQLKYILTHDRLDIFEHTLVRFMLDTAIRREELTKAKIADIDFKNRVLHIPEAKGKKFRSVPFSEHTLFWLELYRSMRKFNSEYVFSLRENEAISYVGVGMAFQKISQTLGFRVHAHEMRHTAGRLWAEAGVNQYLIMIYMGHEDPKMTRQYIHTTANKLKEIQDKIYKSSETLSKHQMTFITSKEFDKVV